MTESSNTPRRLKALLFDIDGTLADTDIYHRQVFKEILQPLNIECDDHYYNTHISGKANRDLHKELVPHLDEPAATKFFEDKETAFREAARQNLKPLSGLIQLMQRCREQGIKIATVSNAPKPNVEMMLQLFGLATEGQPIGAAGTHGPNGVLDTCVLGDDCQFSKPHPEPYFIGMKRLNVKPEECIVFEDSSSGVKAGVSAGCYTVGVMTTKTESQMREMGANAVIDNYDEIDVDAMINKMTDFVIRSSKQ